MPSQLSFNLNNLQTLTHLKIVIFPMYSCLVFFAVEKFPPTIALKLVYEVRN